MAVVKLSACHYSRLGKNARRGWLKVKVAVGDGQWRLGGTSVLVRRPNPSRKLGEWAWGLGDVIPIDREGRSGGRIRR